MLTLNTPTDPGQVQKQLVQVLTPEGYKTLMQVSSYAQDANGAPFLIPGSVFYEDADGMRVDDTNILDLATPGDTASRPIVSYWKTPSGQLVLGTATNGALNFTNLDGSPFTGDTTSLTSTGNADTAAPPAAPVKMRYVDTSFNLASGQMWDIENMKNMLQAIDPRIEISSVAVAGNVPFRRGDVTIQNLVPAGLGGAPLTFDRHFNHTITGHNDNDSISGPLRVIVQGDASVVMGVRVRVPEGVSIPQLPPTTPAEPTTEPPITDGGSGDGSFVEM
jgi:hypothetical protein